MSTKPRNNGSGDRPDTHRSRPRLIWLLLLAPYVGLLWVPFYDVLTPEIWGFPFFYWYQLLWVPITAFLTWLVYRKVRHDD